MNAEGPGSHCFALSSFPVSHHHHIKHNITKVRMFSCKIWLHWSLVSTLFDFLPSNGKQIYYKYYYNTRHDLFRFNKQRLSLLYFIEKHFHFICEGFLLNNSKIVASLSPVPKPLSLSCSTEASING